MSRSDSILNATKEAIHQEIINLVDVDGYSWEQVSELAGYSGVNSMKNIVTQAAHKLSFARGVTMLKGLSKDENHRMHKFVIDTNHFSVNPRPTNYVATGSLMEEHHQMMMEMHQAESALEAGNVNNLYSYYKHLLGLAAKVQSEMQSLQIKLKKHDSEGSLNQVLKGKAKIKAPSMVSTRSREKHNDSARLSMCKDNQNSSCRLSEQVENKV